MVQIILVMKAPDKFSRPRKLSFVILIHYFDLFFNLRHPSWKLELNLYIYNYKLHYSEVVLVLCSLPPTGIQLACNMILAVCAVNTWIILKPLYSHAYMTKWRGGRVLAVFLLVLCLPRCIALLAAGKTNRWWDSEQAQGLSGKTYSNISYFLHPSVGLMWLMQLMWCHFALFLISYSLSDEHLSNIRPLSQSVKDGIWFITLISQWGICINYTQVKFWFKGTLGAPAAHSFLSSPCR